MKKTLKLWGISAVFTVAFFLLHTTDVKAQEKEADGFEKQFKTMVSHVLEREEIDDIWGQEDEEVFFQGLTEEELYQLVVLYRYSLVEQTVQECPAAERKEVEEGQEVKNDETDCSVDSGEDDGAADSQDDHGGEHPRAGYSDEDYQSGEIKEMIEKELEFYQKMQDRIHMLRNEKKDEDQGGREQKERLWRDQAFSVFKTVVLEEDNQEISDFDEYMESRKVMTAFDPAELVCMLEKMNGTDENAEEAFNDTIQFLYGLYNICGEESKSETTENETAENETVENETVENEAVEDETGEKEKKSVTKNMTGSMLTAPLSASGAGVTYRAYCQTTAWQAWSSNGGTTGSPDSQKRVEALQVKVTGDTGLGITYQAHVQSQGWMSWASNGASVGTSGQALRMEAVRMKLTGESAGKYDLYYRAYCESYGWLDWAKNGQSAGTVNIAKRIEALQIILTGKGSAAPGATGTPLQTNAVARVGSKYYKTFNEAFDVMASGGTLYVIRSCEATHIVTTKSFYIYPEERSVKVTFRETSIEPAGIICTPTGSGSPTWTFGGNGEYTITFDASQKGGSGVLSNHAGIVNLKSGVCLTNSYGNGVWNMYGTTNVYDGVSIYGNKSNGIATMGNINMYGGKIYNNGYDGMRCEQTIKISGGEIYGNRKSGVHVGEGSCTLIMTGGKVHNNEYGVENANGKGNIQISAGDIYGNKLDGVKTQGEKMTINGSVQIHGNGRTGVAIDGGTATIAGGKIYSNPSAGIVNKSVLSITGGEIYSNTAENGAGIANIGTLTMAGGSVTGNTASNVGGGIGNLTGGRLELRGGTVKSNTAKAGKGVYHNGTAMNISGNGTVSSENDVFLSAGKFVSVTGKLNAQLAAVLTPSNYANGRKAAECLYDTKMGSLCFQKFALTPNGGYCLRPGNYQVSQSGAENKDIVLSSKYAVRFNKNFDGTIKNLPADTEKYWYESLRLPALTPTTDYLKFRGWSENASAEKAEYQPGNEINASINKALTLYAVWGTKIQVNYIGNRNMPGEARSEYVTLKDCLANKGYMIRKNAEFTKYEGKNAAFAGWDIQPKAANAVRFSEKQNCKLTFEQLLRLAAEQQGKDYLSDAVVQEINLYAAWDEFPVITAQEVLEFYEGTEVTKEMLLQNVEAKDREDGSITENIKIKQVDYADGKLSGGEKQKGKKELWKDDIPEDYHLDTWFMQMAEEDSPVVHKITYAVQDSFGNVTNYEWDVKVKYNEFPEITVEDRYFTLEEAQNGMITAEKLLTDAVSEGRIQVSDQEDDVLYPGELPKKIKLEDFHEDEFQSFEESGYVVITYSVKDSMGPDGEGKETIHQCIVHVVKDGEVEEPEAQKYVRFINQEYYEKNQEGKEDESGGLHAESRWYHDPEYKNTIMSAWQEGKAPKEAWTFSREDVGNVKKYIKEHGIGNSQEMSALAEFNVRFGDKKKME